MPEQRMYIKSECGVSMAKTMQRSKKAGTKIMVEPDEPLRVYADAGNVYIQMMSVVGLCSVV